MDKGVISGIIDAANRAPSGGNSQPWSFEVSGDTLTVRMFPEREHPIMNYRNRGTLFAHGALLENLSIAAHHAGVTPHIEVLPEEHVSARITFSPDNPIQAPLYEAIANRHSNRKPYATEPLPEERKRFLLADVSAYAPARVALVEGEVCKEVAACTARDIELNLENPTLHEAFFKEVLWSEEDEKRGPGLFVKTMEAVPPQSTVMKLLQKPSVARLFTKLGLTKKITQANAKTLGAAALCGAIIVPEEDGAFLRAGRLAENVWLRATKEGLRFQLMAGVIFLRHHAHAGAGDIFNTEERAMLDTAYTKLEKLFGVRDGEVIAAAFRVGEAPPPLAVSYTRPAEVRWD